MGRSDKSTPETASHKTMDQRRVYPMTDSDLEGKAHMRTEQATFSDSETAKPRIYAKSKMRLQDELNVIPEAKLLEDLQG